MTNRNRNEPCPCDSGLKQKKCHFDPAKIQLAKKAYTDKLNELVQEELYKQIELETKKAIEKELEKELNKNLKGKNHGFNK